MGAAVFTGVYWPLARLELEHTSLYFLTFAFLYAVWGLALVNCAELSGASLWFLGPNQKRPFLTSFASRRAPLSN